MRLLVVHDKPRAEFGGMNSFITAQLGLFARAGWQATEAVCTPEASPGVLHLAPTGRRVFTAAQVPAVEMIDTLRPDVVFLHSVYYAVGARVLPAISRRVPMVYLLHDVTPLCPRQTRLTRAGERCDRRQGLGCIAGGCYRIGEEGRPASDAYGLLIRRLQMDAALTVPHWVVPSRYLGDLLAQHGVRRERIAVVPHFVEPGGVPNGPPVDGRIFFAGRLVPEKGPQLLLEALAALQAENWSLAIAGDGPQRAELQELARKFGIDSRIEWCGQLGAESMARQYARAAIVAMPSLIPESFGLVGLEAMAHGRPVVGFASGGMVEWLRDGVTGRVAEWGNARSLAKVIAELLARPELAARLGRCGHEAALQEFAPQLHLQRMRKVFDGAIAEVRH